MIHQHNMSCKEEGPLLLGAPNGTAGSTLENIYQHDNTLGEFSKKIK